MLRLWLWLRYVCMNHWRRHACAARHAIGWQEKRRGCNWQCPRWRREILDGNSTLPAAAAWLPSKLLLTRAPASRQRAAADARCRRALIQDCGARAALRLDDLRLLDLCIAHWVTANA